MCEFLCLVLRLFVFVLFFLTLTFLVDAIIITTYGVGDRLRFTYRKRYSADIVHILRRSSSGLITTESRWNIRQNRSLIIIHFASPANRCSTSMWLTDLRLHIVSYGVGWRHLKFSLPRLRFVFATSLSSLSDLCLCHESVVPVGSLSLPRVCRPCRRIFVFATSLSSLSDLCLCHESVVPVGSLSLPRVCRLSRIVVFATSLSSMSDLCLCHESVVHVGSLSLPRVCRPCRIFVFATSQSSLSDLCLCHESAYSSESTRLGWPSTQGSTSHGLV